MIKTKKYNKNFKAKIKIKKKITIDLKSRKLKTILKKISLKAKNKKIKTQLIKLFLLSKKMYNYDVTKSFFYTKQSPRQLGLPIKKLDLIKAKLTKSVKRILKKKKKNKKKNYCRKKYKRERRK